jgi:porphobilinogen synthase
MVKPAGWYLDIVHQFKSKSTVPVAAYQVSGEYSMIHAAAQAGYIDLDKAIYESLISIKRAGADLILSYFAKDILKH